MSTEAADRWIGRFPLEHRPTVEAYFRHVLSRGVTDPTAVVAQVLILAGDKLAWAVEPSSKVLFENVLESLVTGREGALAYAKKVLQETQP
jgi:hypothetical protein